jgi:hypothetical protein
MDSQLAEYLSLQTPQQLESLQSLITAMLEKQGQDSKAIKFPRSKKATQKEASSIKRGLKGRAPTATRPLNSFMAFRAYYSPIFKKSAQKDISSWVNKLWAADPYTTKWTLIAKSYSIIRDRVGKEAAPLDQFLQIVCPLMEIMPPDLYLIAMGWLMLLNSSVRPELIRNFVPDNTSFNLTTTMSSNDIVAHCNTVGYPSGLNGQDSSTLCIKSRGMLI